MQQEELPGEGADMQAVRGRAAPGVRRVRRQFRTRLDAMLPQRINRVGDIHISWSRAGSSCSARHVFMPAHRFGRHPKNSPGNLAPAASTSSSRWPEHASQRPY
ncbi:hypothetical protein [Streptomyces sp. AM8-1-1]|uniref:hypothetical protein n=1 Tax=Streptomyces sp. AM8-1-1 TaxID=3075825 RepID=UPI0028C48FEF|nr:hypothetical protein [Streptomyces sp. AM8-1-1]WNO76866.1 hypothetical protein RPQ07_36945 [Streptomyces sp. AM8-1-1]